MSKIIHSVPAQGANMSLSMNLDGARTAPPQIDDAAVEEMCEYLLKEKLRDLRADHIAPEARESYRKAMLPNYFFDDGGFRRQCVEKEDFQRLLRPWKRELGRLMLASPRNEGASIAGYFKHLCNVGSHDRWPGRFDRMGGLLAHIHRIEAEERAERERVAAQRKREEDERRARERARLAELERQATPDLKEIKRLWAVIAEAKDVEEMMARLERARAAGVAIAEIYLKVQEACAALGRPLPDDMPKVVSITTSNPLPMNGEGPRHSTGNGLHRR